MKLYIFPKYMEEASKTGWIVRWLQAVGIIQVLGCIILGATVGGPLIANALTQAGVMSQEAASASSLLIGLAAGILVGLWFSMAVFAIAQALDDLHAIRIQTEAHVAFETEEIKMGR